MLVFLNFCTILVILCLVDFLAFAFKLPIQTSLSVVPTLPVCLRSGDKCESFRKTSTPLNTWTELPSKLNLGTPDWKFKWHVTTWCCKYTNYTAGLLGYELVYCYKTITTLTALIKITHYIQCKCYFIWFVKFSTEITVFHVLARWRILLMWTRYWKDLEDGENGR